MSLCPVLPDKGYFPSTSFNQARLSSSLFISFFLKHSATAGMDDIDDTAMIAALEAAEASLPAARLSASAAAVAVATSPVTKASKLVPAPVPSPPRRLVVPSADLLKTLETNFGFSDFRPGQLPIIEAALSGRDTSVFWSTGSGKSLCYQVPALYIRDTHITVVCSPLISLMQDQVLKLNATAGEGRRELATFLGSAQGDSSAEARALAGEFALVYVSPEKLINGFLTDLVAMHNSGMGKKVGLFAVDEAHCVSEWGHDFRAEFRRLGEVRAALPHVPVMALTATAVPRVRADVRAQLGMAADALVDINSFDRPNLVLDVRGREAGKLGSPSVVAFVLRELATALNEEAEVRVGGAPKSTIVYCSTRAEVESVFEFLKEACSPSCRMWVERYHAGRSTAERRRVHNSFVSNSGSAVVVATVAFGMGIDKPDIRRVVHYGPPKSCEEYYQQIGRAGRDGLKSECVMHANDGDFGRFDSAFYTESLAGVALQAYQASLKSLREYAREAVRCRRKLLLEYLGEADAPFGQRCGTCDTCCRHAGGESLEHDYGLEARVVLQAVLTLRAAPKTKLFQLVTGASGSPVGLVAQRRKRMAAVRAAETGGSARAVPNLKMHEAILAQLVQTRYVNQKSMRNEYSTYDVYGIEESGIAALNAVAPNASASIREPPILLPLSSSMLEVRAAHEANKASLVETIVDLSIDPETIPTVALESGEITHPLIRSIVRLALKLKMLRATGHDDRVEQATAIEALHSSVRGWRDRTAASLNCAPSSVLSDALVANVVYTEIDDVVALRQAGVRVAGVEDLAVVVAEWKTKHRSAGPSPSSAEKCSAPMVLPSTFWLPAKKFQPPQAYKPRKPSAKQPESRPTWEVSADLVASGKSIQSIALNQANGKSIQVNTVFKHCLQALEFRRPQGGLPLYELAAVNLPPSEEEWKRLDEAAAMVGADIMKWEVTPPRKDFAVFELGDEVNAYYGSKSAEQLGIEAAWYTKIDWFITLKRIGFAVRFAHSAASTASERVEREPKRQKLSV